MSIVVPEQKKPWILIAAAIAIVLAVGTTIALVDLPGQQLLSRRGDAAGEGDAIPDVPQATWDISIKPSNGAGHLTRAQKKAMDRQRPALRSLVMSVYDSLFVHTDRLPETLKAHFTEPAAVALKRARAGAAEAGRVSTRLRRAEIGVQPVGGSRMAVAAVTVRAVGEGAARPVVHRSALWLERVRGDWKVVAFDVRQEPAPAKSKSGGKASAKKKRNKRG